MKTTETNFMDMVSRAKRVVLSLNLPFHELYDPRGMAKDATSLDRWSNGYAEMGLSTVDNLSYFIELIHQAFEKQICEGEAVA
jgi:predicted transport protein